MRRTWRAPLTSFLLAAVGCAQPAARPDYVEVVANLHAAAHRPPESIRPDDPDAIALDPAPTPPDLLGPRPVDAFLRRALAENRTVQAARSNALALEARIPQVTALDDPVVSNTIYPIPSVAPQYSLMGYNPYNLMIAQQFPWSGTLRLRGQAAAQDVKVALAELCAAELDAVAAVKRAYHDLAFNEQAEAILRDNRALAVDFVAIAKERYKTAGTTQQDVLRAEVAVADIDRELERIRLGLSQARADLAQQLHIHPDSELHTLPPPLADVPAALDRLYRLAVAARPELRGRLAAIARDERAVELARKRYYPNITVGLSYMDMERTNAQTPKTAGGVPNVGLFVGFNLPVYKAKLDAAVCEAQHRTVADARLYDAERDATYREIKGLLTQAGAQRNILDLFRGTILPKSRQALEATTSDYRAGNADYATLVTAWREVLQIQIQVAQTEAELAKVLASLERVVGVQLMEHSPAPPPTTTGAERADQGIAIDPPPPSPDGVRNGQPKPGPEERRLIPEPPRGEEKSSAPIPIPPS